MTDHLMLFEDLVRVETRLWNELDRALQDSQGVSLAWLLPLRVLDTAPGSRVHDLAADIGISPGGASKLVDRLVAADLVSREVDETDRRASRLTLTRAGRRTTRAAAKAAGEWLQTRFDQTLGQEATTDLADLLGALRGSRRPEAVVA